MASHAETTAMRRAIALSRSPRAPLGPNPRVGAVLLDTTGAIVAEGFHRGTGSIHAEVDALNHAGELAAGATAVVTLEPCDHQGRTGPCSQALISAGVSRVVYAQADTSAVARGGAKSLAAAGVDVESGLLGDQAAATNETWTFAHRFGRPFVTWKLAASLDGRSAAYDGTSRWITGPAARADVHRLRALCDAIVVGTGTVLADNPSLTVRDARDEPLPPDRQPVRVVMGLRDIPTDAAVLDASARTRVMATRDPDDVLAQLWDMGCQHVWLEGGPTVAAAFMGGHLVDEIVAYLAPVLLGAGAPCVAELGIGTLDEALRLATRDVTRLGDDIRVTMRGRR